MLESTRVYGRRRAARACARLRYGQKHCWHQAGRSPEELLQGRPFNGRRISVEFFLDPLPQTSDLLGRFSSGSKFGDGETCAHRILVIVAHDNERLREDVAEI